MDDKLTTGGVLVSRTRYEHLLESEGVAEHEMSRKMDRIAELGRAVSVIRNTNYAPGHRWSVLLFDPVDPDSFEKMFTEDILKTLDDILFRLSVEYD